MAKSSQTIPQNYPRIDDRSAKEHGLLDDSKLAPHRKKFPMELLKKHIGEAITNAGKKSSREILSTPEGITEDERIQIYRKKGRELFGYFKRYVGDPAATAHQITGKDYKQVGKEIFNNLKLQKERMNSGWRYQFLAFDCALASGRFKSVSDIGAAEADFNAVIEFKDKSKESLNLYVSVKNRKNTMGGQDWPKAIMALERIASSDKNRKGPYCCVFGIAMDRGARYIKIEQKTGNPQSFNTEIWLSDFFWPFFSNYSYEEIMRAVLDVLIDGYAPDKITAQVEIPEELLETFAEYCRKSGLIDAQGKFHDPYKLVTFFCGK